ncbi:ATP-binding protein [Ramlibacter sp. Leaf400]|uniref:ATP-binding protein n=1 Tax=Ramlibacter sp. Leaf400 TaxID=1736365 RepID=UPI0009E87BB5|nr:ATP-binding protein [Ramlibacter sp. Leaf400]
MDPDSALDRNPALSWALAVVAPSAATAASHVLDGALSLAGLAMIYMVAVAASSAILPRGPAALSALLSVTALNIGFVPPRGSLTVSEPEYWWILAALLGLSLGLGALVRSLRSKRADAETGRSRASQQHRLSEAMAAADGTELLARTAARCMREVTARPCAIYLRRPEGDGLLMYADPEAEQFDDRAAAWAIDNGRSVGAGSLNWPELAVWCAPFARVRAAGAVQVQTGAGQGPTPPEAEHWSALARQAGLAIERERASVAAAHAEQSAKAEAARNTLLASLSHDLRTPLAGIVGSASALRSQGADLTELQRATLLDNLEHEARDLALMADNILQTARLSQPQIDLATQWESVDDVMGAAVTRVRRRWPGASIQLKVPRDLPLVKVEAGLLAQAVANLVDNAVRHGGDPPRVVVQAGRTDEGIFIAVRDHGRGLPPGNAAELFQRWRRGQASHAGGSGLGLAICQLAAEAHGGSVSAKDCAVGAEFRMDLPASEKLEGAA